VGQGEVLTVTRPTPPASDPLRRLAAGDAVTITWPASAGRLLAPDTATDGAPEEGG